MTSSVQEQLLSYCSSWSYTTLQDVKKFLRSEGNPHKRLSIYHVAWTNWKGSTCAMISQVLWKQFWKKVWLFVSPHVVKLNERIQINGNYISNEDILQYASLIYKKTSRYGIKLSYFALMTLISIWYFVDNNLDCVVYEVGLWGTLDTTNLWDNPLATFITSIWIDHTRLLWNTRSQIQWNKMWIMKAWVPCYTPVDNQLMHRGARCKKAKLVVVNECVETNLLWNHQCMNAWLVYQALVDQHYDSTKIKQWLLTITHPWRLQFVKERLLLDGAHNKEWIIALWKYIDSVRDQYDTLITIFWTSKFEEEFDTIVPVLIEWNENYCIAPSYFRERTVRIDEYCNKASFPMKPIHSLDSLLGVYADKAKTEKNLVLVYGSLYLVSDVLGKERK